MRPTPFGVLYREIYGIQSSYTDKYTVSASYAERYTVGDSYTGNDKVGDSSPTGDGENCSGHVTSQAPFENCVADDGASLAGGKASICNEVRIERIYSRDQTNRISLVKPSSDPAFGTARLPPTYPQSPP